MSAPKPTPIALTLLILNIYGSVFAQVPKLTDSEIRNESRAKQLVSLALSDARRARQQIQDAKIDDRLLIDKMLEFGRIDLTKFFDLGEGKPIDAVFLESLSDHLRNDTYGGHYVSLRQLFEFCSSAIGRGIKLPPSLLESIQHYMLANEDRAIQLDQHVEKLALAIASNPVDFNIDNDKSTMRRRKQLIDQTIAAEHFARTPEDWLLGIEFCTTPRSQVIPLTEYILLKLRSVDGRLPGGESLYKIMRLIGSRTDEKLAIEMTRVLVRDWRKTEAILDGGLSHTWYIVQNPVTHLATKVTGKNGDEFVKLVLPDDSPIFIRAFEVVGQLDSQVLEKNRKRIEHRLWRFVDEKIEQEEFSKLLNVLRPFKTLSPDGEYHEELLIKMLERHESSKFPVSMQFDAIVKGVNSVSTNRARRHRLVKQLVDSASESRNNLVRLCLAKNAVLFIDSFTSNQAEIMLDIMLRLNSNLKTEQEVIEAYRTLIRNK